MSQQLGVANVLEGTVQKAADKVRINVQLIDARADSHRSFPANAAVKVRAREPQRLSSPI